MLKNAVKWFVATYLFDRWLQNDVLFRMITGVFIAPHKTRKEKICGHSILFNIPSITVFDNLTADLASKNEQATINFLLKTLKDGDVFADIGTNIGVYPLLANELVRLDSAIAIEPASQNFAELVRNTMLNGHDATVCLHCALGDHNAFVDFPAGDLIPGYQHSRIGKDEGYREKVQLMTFDSLTDEVEFKLPTVILIDIDGAEVDALRGMTRALANPELRVVIVEVDPKTSEDVEQILTAVGFIKIQERPKNRGNEFYERR